MATTSILIYRRDDNWKSMDSKTLTALGKRTSPTEEQSKNVTTTSSTYKDLDCTPYYQSSPVTTDYRLVRPYLESKALIKLAACFSITTATLYTLLLIRASNSRIEKVHNSKNMVLPMCTKSHIAISRYANPASNRDLTKILNGIVYALITKLCMVNNYNSPVSDLLCAPQHSEYQKHRGARKTLEHGRSVASPPFCGPAAETPAPQDPVNELINHALYPTNSSLINTHRVISHSISPDKNHCHAYYYSRHTSAESWNLTYLLGPDKVQAVISTTEILPNGKTGSEIRLRQLSITTNVTINLKKNFLLSCFCICQSHLIFSAFLDACASLLPSQCYWYFYGFKSAAGDGDESKLQKTPYTCQDAATATKEASDTASGDGSKNGGNDCSENQDKTSDSKTRRSKITSRSALFNGSRHNTNSLSSNGGDEDGEDEEDERGSRLLLQCQVSTIPEQEESEAKLDHEVDTDWADQPPFKLSQHGTTNIAPSSPQNVMVSAINSTQIDHNQPSNYMFDMSVLQGISRISYSIWESAKNVSLFGRGPHNKRADDETSVCSDLSGLPDISEISLNITINNTTTLEDNMPQSNPSEPEIVSDDSEDDDHCEQPSKGHMLYTGVAKPDITPTPAALKLKEFRLLRSSLVRSKIRTRSECSPLIKAGSRPYDLPPTVLLKRKQRANLRTRGINGEETPVSLRRRNLSEPSSEAASTLGDIDCIRPREPGLYDCSNGLGSYFHIDHNYLDKPDTGKIDKKKLMSELMKVLSISGDEQHSRETDSTVTLAWNEGDIDAVSKTRAYGLSAHHIDQRNCLMYLLGRIINNSSRLLSFRPNFNGLKIIFLHDRAEKLPLECPLDNEGQPIIVLHLGHTTKSVSLIPKKHDLLRLNVYDIELENCSLLTIFPDTYQHMNISLAGKGTLSRNEEDLHVLLVPCYVSPEDKTIEPTPGPKEESLSEELASAVEEPTILTTIEDHGKKPIEATSINNGNTAKYLESDVNDLVQKDVADEKTTVSNATAEVIGVFKERDREKGVPGCDNDKTPAGKVDNHISTPKVNDLGPTIAADTIGDANANDIDGNEELEVSSATHATSAIAAEPSNDANEEDGNDASVYGATNNEDGSKCKQGNDEARKNSAAKESVEDTITGHEGLTRNCAEQHSAFISMDLCIEVVNSNNKDTIINWLSECGIKGPKKKKRVQKHRAVLLKHIKTIADGNTLPKIFFLTSFLKNISYPQLREEARRLKICIPKGSLESQARRVINEHLASGIRKASLILKDEENTCESKIFTAFEDTVTDDHDALLGSAPAPRAAEVTIQVKDTDRFISMKTCVDVVNTYKKKVIFEWLSQCGIAAPEKAQGLEYRELLLEHIQGVIEGKVKPQISFLTSFLEKITCPQLREEACRLKIIIPKNTTESAARLLIKKHITNDLTRHEAPPGLLKTDEELSASEADSDFNEREPVKHENKACHPPINEISGGKKEKTEEIESVQRSKKSGLNEQPLHTESKNNPKKKKKNKKKKVEDIQKNHVTNAKEETASCDRKKQESKSSSTSRGNCGQCDVKEASSLPYEQHIRTLEGSLLDLQDRLAKHELLTETLRQNYSQTSITSSIKTLESKNKILFDALNKQQTSIDVFQDSLLKTNKEEKKKSGQISQLKGTVDDNAKQGNEALSSLKNDIARWMQECEVMFSELRKHIDPIAKQTGELANEVQAIREELQTLKLGERSACNMPNQAKTKNCENCKSKEDPIMTALASFREENRIFLESISKDIKQRAVSNNTTQNNHNKEKDEGQMKRSISKKPEVPPNVATGIPASNGEARFNSIKRVHGTGSACNTDKQTLVPGQQPVPQNENQSSQKNEPQTSYRRDLSNNITYSARPRMTSGRSGDTEQELIRNTTNKSIKPHSKNSTERSDRNQGGESSSGTRYRKRKCLILHDHYLETFDSSKFSRWFDVETMKFTSLQEAVKCKSLPAKITNLNPEVVFLHVGHCDVLNKTSVEKFLLEMKKLIQNLLTHTTAKLCVSLIVPILGIPAINTTIGHINKQLAGHISQLRVTPDYRNRIYTSNNNDLSGFVQRSVGEQGVELSLNETGQRKLWLHLKDGLNRALELALPRRKGRNSDTPRNSENNG